MTPSAYLTLECWTKLDPALARAIRRIPVICDHPDWWVKVTMDGLLGHLGHADLLTSEDRSVERRRRY